MMTEGLLSFVQCVLSMLPTRTVIVIHSVPFVFRFICFFFQFFHLSYVDTANSTVVKYAKSFASHKARRAALISVSLAVSRLTLRDHRYGVGASRGVPVYAPPLLVLIAPTRGGMARLSCTVSATKVVQIYERQKIHICKFWQCHFGSFLA